MDWARFESDEDVVALWPEHIAAVRGDSQGAVVFTTGGAKFEVRRALDEVLAEIHAACARQTKLGARDTRTQLLEGQEHDKGTEQ